MKILKDKVAAITGAASGIGRALAIGLAARGCHLAISDINEKGLQETADLITNEGIKISTHRVDVSDQGQVHQYARDVQDQHSRVSILVNNAGVAVAGSIENVSFEDFEWVVNINFWGVVYGTKAFLPYLKKAPEAHIVNISSINGILPNPYNGPYCATKFAVKGFTETLWQELKNTSVGVTVVHPGGIKTNIARNALFPIHTDVPVSQQQLVDLYEKKFFKTTAEKAAQVIISAIERNQQRVLIGLDAKIMDRLTRHFPKFSIKLINSLTYKYFGQKT